MSYDSAISNLYALGHELANTPSHKFDLAHMRVLLEALGNPHRRFPSVLIAGTNGKGSTAASLAAIVQSARYRTALYTSPHLIRLNERLRINGLPIDDASFAAIHERVEELATELVAKSKLPWHPSFFEMLTAIAFEHFAESKIDIAVLEVGMGGRLDATNVVEPLVSVITDISLDHQKFLGNTIAEIAGEKAGIIHPSGTVVLLPQHPEANDVLGKTILERGAHPVSAVPYVPPVSPTTETKLSYPLEVMGEQIEVRSPLVGRHQLRNIALAIAAAVELNQHGFHITPNSIEQGVAQTRWPGRFQTIPAQDGNPEFILDVAHNPAGAWALRAAMSQFYPDRPFTLVFGAMRDKQVGEIAEILFPLAERIIAAPADNPRSASVEDIRQAAHRTSAEIIGASKVAAAIREAKSKSPANGLVVVTGSIYIVGEAMRELGIVP